MTRSFKHSLLVLLLVPLAGHAQVTDLLAAGADGWQAADGDRWQFVDGEIRGSTSIFDGEKTDPAASTFLGARDIVEDDAAGARHSLVVRVGWCVARQARGTRTARDARLVGRAQQS